MGKPQILEKLSQKLKSVPESEESVVYILSRIRKILEIDDHPEKYQILNFYCNLALHSKIDHPPKIVQEKLARIADGTDYGQSMIGFGDLRDQFLKFFIEHNLPNFYERSTPKERKHLYQLLLNIYDETPIYTQYRDAKYRVEVDVNGTISFSPA
jgi:hypothetical protein